MSKKDEVWQEAKKALGFDSISDEELTDDMIKAIEDYNSQAYPGLSFDD